ncbi:phosducin-like protein 3 isoform X1 [Apostichopus japonicus]|uniref:phosducin-like protein 3 isoform X1 n=2 Tax=Stichopus japonicus TaxID=307972 RepID=UPI003AB590FE
MSPSFVVVAKGSTSTVKTCLSIEVIESTISRFYTRQVDAFPNMADEFARDTTKAEAEHIIKDEALAEEELLAELENGDIPPHIREARLDQLKQEAQQFEQRSEKGYGTYSEIEKEPEVFDITRSEEKVVIHFFHPDFRRCNIIDKHLKVLAEKHFNAKFAKMNVEKCDFLVKKLKIQVLPAILCFKEGINVDRVVGFEELGNTDNFDISVLERRLAKSGVLNLPDVRAEGKTIFGFTKTRNGSSSSSDED